MRNQEPPGHSNTEDDGFEVDLGDENDEFYSRHSFRSDYLRDISIPAVVYSSHDDNDGNGFEGNGEEGSRLGICTLGSKEDYDAEGEIAQLYFMCEAALPQSVEDCVSSQEEEARRQQRVKMWDGIREWLRDYPSAHERLLAARYQGQDGASVIHLVCKSLDPPLDVVEAIISCAPDVVSRMDAHGWLPLHLACHNNASFAVLRRLVYAYPEGRVMRDLRGRTPIVFAFFRADATAEEADDEIDDDEEEQEQCGIIDSFAGPPSTKAVENDYTNIIKLLSDTGAAKIPDENGMIPMHYASAYGTSTAILRVLEAAHRKGVVAQESKGRTPLHLAMVNSHRKKGPSVVKFLVESGAELGIVDIPDNEGQLPLHLLVIVRKGGHSYLTLEMRENITKCLEIYLAGEPKSSADIFNVTKKLPGWLFQELVMNYHFQGILNAQIIRRWPTAILLLDLHAHVWLIICFSQTSREYIRLLSANPATNSSLEQPLPIIYVWVQIVCGAYFLIREILQVAAIIAHVEDYERRAHNELGWVDIVRRGISLWLFDGRINWLDVSVVGLTLANSALMLAETPYLGMYNTDKRPHLRMLLASTQIILWIALLFYIMSVYIGFAIFMGGVAYITRRLVYFGLCIIVFLVAFAMMFHIIYFGSEVCLEPQTFQNEECYSGFPHCNFWRSLIKVGTMMMGEIGKECRYLYDYAFLEEEVSADSVLYPNFKHASRAGTFVYVLYAFIFVFIISTVLIAVVGSHFQVFEMGHSTRVFWLNRFDFMVEIEAISNLCKPFLDTLCSSKGDKHGAGRARNTSDVVVQEIPGVVGVVTGNLEHGGGGIFVEEEEKRPMEEMWNALFSVLDLNLFKEMKLRPTMADFWVFVVLKLIAMVCIFLWVIAGYLSAGILWPPQVRKHLFTARKSSAKKHKTKPDQFRQDVRCLKKRLVRTNKKFKQDIGSERTSLQDEIDSVTSAQKDMVKELAKLRTIVASLKQVERKN
mmetsp:Transcript_44438/g.135450  ORF Transcript_44438/g.135450 Transcript_44438/m.135450 type:complete len:984 (-) Transcript_44438:129-3080(-)|eukprot:CAMPEP_0113542062 /NCGR_PEP_ID=MMETSP0015_2-20120614/9393_1 /TAXON_ID=2838 /ORGANISM="Odontella" /LENGTH=983 /DNA_ID=CAMNT_0000442067 /DNA_START=43 /DNA_END=2994 /DNA_ORIENTATION=- /assembly_acc=CAM_ASM_000160